MRLGIHLKTVLTIYATAMISFCFECAYSSDRTYNCSKIGSEDTDSPMMTVDLQRQYLLERIAVYLEDEGTVHRRGRIQVSISNNTGTGKYDIYTKIIDDTSLISFNTSFSQPQPLRFIYILPPVGAKPTVCEIIAWEKVCDFGKFGYGCVHTCYCADNQTCDEATGTCKSAGCISGWWGPACDRRCKAGYLGANCPEDDSRSLLGVIGGSVAAVLFLLFVCTLILLLRCRKSRSSRSGPAAANCKEVDVTSVGTKRYYNVGLDDDAYYRQYAIGRNETSNEYQDLGVRLESENGYSVPHHI